MTCDTCPKGEIVMQIINRDSKGRIIKDLSEVTLSEELSKDIKSLMVGSFRASQKEERSVAQ